MFFTLFRRYKLISPYLNDRNLFFILFKREELTQLPEPITTKMVKQQSTIPIVDTHEITNSIRTSYLSHYTAALSLKPMAQPHFIYIFLNLLILLFQFNILSLLLSFREGSLFLLPISFSLYFLLIFFSFTIFSAFAYQKILKLPISFRNLVAQLSFTLFYLPIALFIAYLLGPLAFIFVFAVALVNNYHVLLLLTNIRAIDSQRTYFFTSLAVLIASFLMCYGCQIIYFSAIEVGKQV